MIENSVIQVDENDNVIGKIDKMQAHIEGVLHRAVSVFIVNSKGQWLLQKRALGKYHSAGLWSNTACTHPYPNETIMEAALRRLNEEMGLTVELKKIFHFVYKEALDNMMTEYEFDHVFVGQTDQIPHINQHEAIAYRYVNYNDLAQELANKPENFTVWFRKIAQRVHQHISQDDFPVFIKSLQ